MEQSDIIKAITTHPTIIIHRHIHPDFDAIGSQIALKKTLQQSFPEKNIFAVGCDAENLEWIGSMDVIEDDQYRDALVIVCDTAETKRISDQRYLLGKTLVKIDHHSDGGSYGDLSWVDPSYSSVCEMLADLFFSYLESFNLTIEAAAALYAGIMGDTGMLKNGMAGERTLRIVSQIKKFSFKPERIHRLMKKSGTDLSKWKQLVAYRAQVTEQGIASLRVTKDMLENLGLDSYEAAPLIHALVAYKPARIWVLFIEEDGKIRVRIRSKTVPVNEIAKKFGGGGHKLAAGALLSSLEEADQVVENLGEKRMR
ncbi:bifunctional oligoribonuclease/PAP phosphatase NrnA [Metabacillus indicus]|uniref:DHH family phosphoesterase n=1 Tax=Metabacillus indicus TaxID=246786 RepID=UPI002A027147|nr:bifunctional oligoribonuclease/PAP phosphatase NrnA [Metabacillus indicus]MDX8290445.1 bifunctional oligoribonuclease/PAP phosphatase NrnA [Metabacillus indicus]